MANMGIRYLAPSKPHGQELLAHIKLATSFLAIYIGLLTLFSVPLDLTGRVARDHRLQPLSLLRDRGMHALAQSPLYLL